MTLKLFSIFFFVGDLTYSLNHYKLLHENCKLIKNLRIEYSKDLRAMLKSVRKKRQNFDEQIKVMLQCANLQSLTIIGMKDNYQDLISIINKKKALESMFITTKRNDAFRMILSEFGKKLQFKSLLIYVGTFLSFNLKRTTEIKALELSVNAKDDFVDYLPSDLNDYKYRFVKKNMVIKKKEDKTKKYVNFSFFKCDQIRNLSFVGNDLDAFRILLYYIRSKGRTAKCPSTLENFCIDTDFRWYMKDSDLQGNELSILKKCGLHLKTIDIGFPETERDEANSFLNNLIDVQSVNELSTHEHIPGRSIYFSYLLLTL